MALTVGPAPLRQALYLPPVALCQRQLLRSRPALNLPLRSERFISGEELLPEDQPHRTPPNGVTTKATVMMSSEAGLEVVRMARVEGSVRAEEHVDVERHDLTFGSA